MVTMAQRIEELRMARNMSRPALAAALGLPKTAVEKFETGRQTPTQEQQDKLAAFFGVSIFYLRGGVPSGCGVSSHRCSKERLPVGIVLPSAVAA